MADEHAVLDLRRLDDGESHLEWTLSAAELAIDEEDQRFDGPVVVALDLFRSDRQVQIQGTLRGVAVHACGRCAEDVRGPFEASFVCLAVERDDTMATGSDDDDDLMVYEGSRIEMGDLIRQHVLLTMPMVVLCRSECKGLCPDCGTNLNESTCSCHRDSTDPRWSALTRLLEDDDGPDRTPETLDVDSASRTPEMDN